MFDLMDVLKLIVYCEVISNMNILFVTANFNG